MKRSLTRPERWARLRFSVVGPLLANPPPRGELYARLKALAQTTWTHPVTGKPVRFGFSTIERWYYRALQAPVDPFGELGRRVRKDAGCSKRIDLELGALLEAQYARHPSWNYKLHADNLAAELQRRDHPGPLPGEQTVRRYMKARGWLRVRKGSLRPGGPRQIRSYQVEQAHALWHLDFHMGSRKVLDPNSGWVSPWLMAVLDDRSRLCCHAQWYLVESAQTVAHGLSQALLKHGLPRSLMSDRGGGEMANEVREGLERLSVVHRPTAPRSPWQNGKLETFWRQIEGRLLPLLDDETELTLSYLNKVTCAFIDLDYHRTRHRALGMSPVECMGQVTSVARPRPTPEQLRQAFTTFVTRRQRLTDGTFTLGGVRFEVPDRYRHLLNLALRHASWDKSRAWLAHPTTGAILTPVYPHDPARYADGHRAPCAPMDPKAPSEPTHATSSAAALLLSWLESARAEGRPPPYIPLNPGPVGPNDEENDDGC